METLSTLPIPEEWVAHADELPTGWRTEFGNALENLCSALNKADRVKDFNIAQVKEKYGFGRLYWDLHGDHDDELYKQIQDIVSTFENNTRFKCADCGQPATFSSKRYILPYCRKCADEWLVRYRVIYKNKGAKFTENFRPHRKI